MRTITTTIEAYKFDELSDEAQEQAIENNREINVHDTFWSDYDCKMGLSNEELKSRKMSMENIFSGDNNCYFDIDRNSHIHFYELKVENEEDFRRWLRVPKQLWYNSLFNFSTDGHRNATTTLEIEPYKDNDEDFTDREQEIIDNAIEIFADKVSKALNDLRNSYEYQYEGEAIKETIIANEMEFEQDGTSI